MDRCHLNPYGLQSLEVIVAVPLRLVVRSEARLPARKEVAGSLLSSIGAKQGMISGIRSSVLLSTAAGGSAWADLPHAATCCMLHAACPRVAVSACRRNPFICENTEPLFKFEMHRLGSHLQVRTAQPPMTSTEETNVVTANGEAPSPPSLPVGCTFPATDFMI